MRERTPGLRALYGRPFSREVLVPVFRSGGRGLLAVLLLLAAGTALTLALPAVTRSLVDRALLGGDRGWLLAGAALLAGLRLAGTAAGYAQQMTSARLDRRIGLELQERFLERTLRLPLAFHDRFGEGYLATRFTSDLGTLRWVFTGAVPGMVSSALRLAGSVVLIMILEWRLALAATLSVPLLFLVASLFAGRMRRLAARAMESNADAVGHLVSGVAASEVVKAYGMEGRVLGGFTGRLDRLLGIGIERTRQGSLAAVSLELVQGAVHLGVLLAGGGMVLDGSMSLGTLIAFQAYLAAVFSPARFLASSSLDLQGAAAALERLDEIWQVEPEEPAVPGGRTEAPAFSTLEFEGVSFGYPGRAPLFDGLSFRASKGGLLAMAGPSGAGKTTLLRLMLLLYRPSGGRILFDGRDADEYGTSALRARIGYVPQVVSLLPGTVLENVLAGSPDASREAVEKALELSGSAGFTASLPLGADTPVGERGVLLSEGQRRRVSLARALVREPALLVLDEPTSSLEHSMASALLDTVRSISADLMCIAVSHDPTVLEAADRVLLIDGGAVAASGTHMELLVSCGLYSRMVSPARPGREDMSGRRPGGPPDRV